MGDEITSAAILISMLVQLRQENRQLAEQLSAAQLLLKALQNDPGLRQLQASAPAGMPIGSELVAAVDTTG